MALPVSTIVFWLIAIMIAGSALLTAAAKNILHAAFALATAFLGVGAMYVFLHADFVAAVQLIVYVGGIIVLIMFAVMFSSNVAEDTSKEKRGRAGVVFGALAAAGVFAVMLLMISRLEKPLNRHNTYAAVDYANTVGVQPRSDEQAVKDAALVAKNDAALNPVGETPWKSLSNDKLKERVYKTLGEKEGKELFDALQKTERGRIGLGHKLVGDYLLPFEVASILLLAALVGAVVIVRKEIG